VGSAAAFAMLARHHQARRAAQSREGGWRFGFAVSTAQAWALLRRRGMPPLAGATFSCGEIRHCAASLRGLPLLCITLGFQPRDDQLKVFLRVPLAARTKGDGRRDQALLDISVILRVPVPSSARNAFGL
jgi:hypothetical protein